MGRNTIMLYEIMALEISVSIITVSFDQVEIGPVWMTQLGVFNLGFIWIWVTTWVTMENCGSQSQTS